MTYYSNSIEIAQKLLSQQREINELKQGVDAAVTDPTRQAEIDLAGIKRVIETVDTARRYVQKSYEMGDSAEDIPDDYVERAALDSWQGRPPWKSEREETLQARIDAATAKVMAVYDLLPIGVCGTHDELFAALAEVRVALSGEEEDRG